MSILTQWISEADNIAIAGHVTPDGDSIGSTLALYNYILDNYPQVSKVTVFLEHAASKFAFLNGFDRIHHKLDDTEFDLFVSCDVSTPERMGEFRPLLDCCSRTFCVDHHETNPHFCQENVIEGGASSTCEVLYKLLDSQKLTKNSAECLYLGIVHDTGVFKYNTTSPDCMRIAADLLTYEIDCQDIIDRTFYRKTFPQLRAWGCAMERAQLAFDGKCCWSYFTWKDLKTYGVSKLELDGIVSEICNLNGVICSVFVYQKAENEWKISMRSLEPFDCTKIVERFEGGGHRCAAGGQGHGTCQEVVDAVLQVIGEYI